MMSCLLWKSVIVLSLVWAVGGQLSGDLRIIYVSGSTEGRGIGRLDVFYNGQWGTVCQDSFSPNDARVACRQLGYTGYTLYGIVVIDGVLGVPVSTPIWLDDLHCSGSERRLIDCPQNSIGSHNCDHSDDVALFCAINGDVRLATTTGSNFSPSGRLELFYDDQWGTVCDDNFSPNDARVACRQLGYDDYTNYGQVGTLGFSQPSSTTPTWLDNLRCLGTESRLIDCPANTIGVEDCTHLEDVALVCTTSNEFTTTAGGDGTEFTTTSGGGGGDGGGVSGGSNIPAYIGGSVGSSIFICVVICCCICCYCYCKSDSSSITREYSVPPPVKTTTVYHAPAKEDPPPRYTDRSVATTETSNRSCTAIHVVERFEGPNGVICQKEQTAIRFTSE